MTRMYVAKKQIPFIFTTSMLSTIFLCHCSMMSGRGVMFSRFTCSCVVGVFFPWRFGRRGPNMVTKYRVTSL